MKRQIVMKIVTNKANFGRVLGVLEKHGIARPWTRVIELSFDRNDPKRVEVARDLKAIGYPPSEDHELLFEPHEIETAELLRLIVTQECGKGFAEWAGELGLAGGSKFVDSREMVGKDIAHTYSFEIIISERLKELLETEHLTGWQVSVVRDARGKSGRFFHLMASAVLPPLDPQTELHREVHDRALEWPLGHPMYGTLDPLLGTVGLFLRGPIYYARDTLTRIADFNRTQEVFGETPQAQTLLIISQRAWRVFTRRSIRGVQAEPVVILD